MPPENLLASVCAGQLHCGKHGVNVYSTDSSLEFATESLSGAICLLDECPQFHIVIDDSDDAVPQKFAKVILRPLNYAYEHDWKIA